MKQTFKVVEYQGSNLVLLELKGTGLILQYYINNNKGLLVGHNSYMTGDSIDMYIIDSYLDIKKGNEFTLETATSRYVVDHKSRNTICWGFFYLKSHSINILII